MISLSNKRQLIHPYHINISTSFLVLFGTEPFLCHLIASFIERGELVLLVEMIFLFLFFQLF